MAAYVDIYDVPPRPPRGDGPPRLPSARQREYYRDLTARVMDRAGAPIQDPAAWLRGFCRRIIGKNAPLTAQDHNKVITALEYRAGRRDRGGKRTAPMLLKRMWALARGGPGELVLRDCVREVTGHRTDSTRHLSRKEAAEVIRRMKL